MDNMYCDLHMHSTSSDGTDAPEALPVLAKRAGLSAIALTDHDTTAGIAACAAAAKKQNIDFIPGIELSANPSFPGLETSNSNFHILGYHILPDDEKLAALEQWLNAAREQRNPRLVARLNELGVAIDYQQVLDEAGEGVVGRPHIAQVMLKKGYVKSIHEAFTSYIGSGAPGHVAKERLSATQAIEAIHEAGGLAVLAHPVQCRLADAAELEYAVTRLKDLGLDGLETRHSDHSPADVAQFQKLVDKLNLLSTGGSDYHGSRKSVALGQCRVGIEAYHQLCAAVQTR